MTLQKRNCPVCNHVALMFEDDKKCWECKTKDELVGLSEEVKKAGVSRCEDYIICPYCGDHYGEDDIHESIDVQCYECRKKFHIEVNYSVDYSTSKIEEKK